MSTDLTPRGSILGVQVHAIDMAAALEKFAALVTARAPAYVCVTPAHAVMDCYNNPDLRAIYNQSSLCTPDGMAIVWLLRWKGHPGVSRVYGPDLLQAVCQDGLSRGYRHYFYGGTPQAVNGLVARLKEQYPGICIAGSESPPFRPLAIEEDQAAVERIRAARPDIVWVGLGSPRQERWMADHVSILNGTVLVGVGAAFDFLSGQKTQAPRWVQRSGLEWFFRLVSEPGRLWKRYVLGYPRFVWLVLLELLRERGVL